MDHSLSAPPITLTPQALERIHHMLASKNAKGIRIKLRSRGCSGMSYVMEYATQIYEEDIVIPLEPLQKNPGTLQAPQNTNVLQSFHSSASSGLSQENHSIDSFQHSPPLEASPIPSILEVKNSQVTTMTTAQEAPPQQPVLLLHKKALMFLLGSCMHYETSDTCAGFVFQNPQEKGRCGCGKSFYA